MPKPSRERQIWRKTYEPGLSDADVRARTAAIYEATIDPWHLSREQSRFADTNAIIARRFGRVGRLLEIGCGEGYQSAWLRQLCDELIGLDIAEAALARARTLVPSGRFHLGGLPDIPLPPGEARFDLAVACEVLYFAPDMRRAIARMREIAPRGLVTGLERKWRRFADAVEGLPGLAIERIADDANSWLVATWSEHQDAGG